MTVPMIKADWTFKVSDVIKIVTLLLLTSAAYFHLSDRVHTNELNIAALDVRTQKTDEALQRHIERETEIGAKAVEVLNRILQTMESFPPHRHTKGGEIIFPTNAK